VNSEEVIYFLLLTINYSPFTYYKREG
jgi:hypothetical protein